MVTLLGFLATNCTISADFHILGTRIRGFISNVYGPLKVVQKQAFIESLTDLKNLVQNIAWIIGGDFNLIRNLDEKKGGIRSLNTASTLFNNTISDLDLIDVRTSNGIFTWNNKQTGDIGITCRLDRFLLLELVMMVEGTVEAVILPAEGSDHWPISLEWDNVRVNPHRPFIFEKFWLLQLDFQGKLKEWWESSPPIRGTCMFQFQQKLKILKDHIKKWNKESFSNILQEKKALEIKIQQHQSQVMLSGYTKELRLQEKTLLKEFNQRKRQEEVYRNQMSRINWLQDGE